MAFTASASTGAIGLWGTFCKGASGLVGAPDWLDTSDLHAYLFGQEVQTPADTRRAAHMYAQWVAAGRDVRLWEEALNRQAFLGDEAFVERMQALMSPATKTAQQIPLQQRGTPNALAAELGLSVTRIIQPIAKAQPARSA